ncbi:ATP-binding protein [Paenibacillus sp. FSL H7-0756]|uniref:ATP-binding protein n=1 Tax=Paenibacillus sp. FSL H7-0756 TaxID=2954738 RepID=UPI0030F51F95
MRSIRIRTFTMLCFCFILMLPWIFYVIAHFMETKTLSFEQGRLPSETLQRNISEITQRIEQGTDRWTDPAWQNQLFSALDEANIDVLIQSAAGQDIYRSNPERHGSKRSTERFSVIEEGQLLGRVILYYPQSNPIQVMAAFAGLLLALFVVGMEMRLERVFEPLYRGEASRSRSTGGSGLGLTISQRIIRQHGGGLAASNHPEGGAMLEGWLPAAAFKQQ